MLQDVGMLLLSRQICCRRNRPKQPKELSSVKPSAFLTGEEVVRAVITSLAQPLPECFEFVQQRLAPVFRDCLCCTQGPLEAMNDDAAVPHVDVVQPKITDL